MTPWRRYTSSVFGSPPSSAATDAGGWTCRLSRSRPQSRPFYTRIGNGRPAGQRGPMISAGWRPRASMQPQADAQGAAGDDGAGLGSIRDLPAFADGLAGRKRSSQRGRQRLPTPHARLVEGLEAEEFVDHGKRFVRERARD